MSFKYSESTKGFYIDSLHLNIPEDAIEITDEEHQELMEQQSNGKVITVIDGVVTTIDPPAPTNEFLATNVRAHRDYQLTLSDWVVIKATETGTSVPQVWLDYRQALRDVTNQPGFPTDVTFPTPPEA